MVTIQTSAWFVLGFILEEGSMNKISFGNNKDFSRISFGTQCKYEIGFY
jgi:hypothetical protein